MFMSYQCYKIEINIKNDLISCRDKFQQCISDPYHMKSLIRSGVKQGYPCYSGNLLIMKTEIDTFVFPDSFPRVFKVRGMLQRQPCA